ncbi:C69 family dipeptidase, partial [Paucilactobacillus suebicus]|uniref:C69 family dipeptidase n=2 Tax=Paucilactobacillus suebicus TaxID=152335 RepID=UPI000A563CD7
MKKYSACTSILVGKKASLDGSVMIGRNEDAKAAWPKHVKIHLRDDLGSHFKSKDNKFEIDLPSSSAKYTATPEWTDKFGLFEEDGINEFGVAMSATESAYSNNNVLIADPLVPDGLNEEAMVTVVLPYIKTAREGVTRLGEIIKQFGTNESNGILFADNDEAWYMETGGGHYWVAQRIPDDGYAVVANQLSIQDIDFNDDANFMYHDGIQKFPRFKIEVQHL